MYSSHEDNHSPLHALAPIHNQGGGGSGGSGGGPGDPDVPDEPKGGSMDGEE
ncbi:MAG: hypothetical protein AAGN66_17200 [Acidobacteriota bacterium]